MQKVRAQRLPARTGEVFSFSGLIFCADCGVSWSRELDALIQRLSEDRVSGQPSGSCEQEQVSPKRRTEALRTAASEAEEQEGNVQAFLEIVQKYAEPSELTPEMLQKPAEKVIVHAPDKSGAHRVQRIDVSHNFMGEVDFSLEYGGTGRRAAVWYTQTGEGAHDYPAGHHSISG